MSTSLQPHELQHVRPPCPSPTPGVHPNPCPYSQWYHPAISSFVIPFSSSHQSFPASGCFQMSQLFPSGGQSIRVSASTSVLPMNTQDWSPLGWTGWIFLQSKGLSRVVSKTTVNNKYHSNLTGVKLFVILCLNILGNINYTVCIKKDTTYGAFSSAVNDKTIDVGCVNTLYRCTTHVAPATTANITTKTTDPKTISITATATTATIIAASSNTSTTNNNKLLLLNCYNIIC